MSLLTAEAGAGEEAASLPLGSGVTTACKAAAAALLPTSLQAQVPAGSLKDSLQASQLLSPLSWALSRSSSIFTSCRYLVPEHKCVSLLGGQGAISK